MIERLQSWVAVQAQRRPEATSVAFKGESMTYGRLEQISNQLARMLIEGGCRRGDRVCLLLPKSPAAIAAILGVLKADCIYVPLDPSCPAPVVKQNDFPELKRLLWCGEVLLAPALGYLMKRLPHVRFTNLYGPTEATIASSYYTVPDHPTDERAAIPIGRPCGGERLFVLDEKLQPVQAGQAGHLYIQGVGLSPKYYRDPQKTSEVFVLNPFSSDPSDRFYGRLGRA